MRSNHRHPWVTVFLRLVFVLALIVTLISGGLWLQQQLVSPPDEVEMSAPSTMAQTESTSRPAPTSSVPASPTPSPTVHDVCTKGASAPVTVTIRKLGIKDAKVERLNPTDGSIGDPSNKHNLGWYPKWPSVKPCAKKGAVLMSGHTYHDNSAVFKESLKDTNTIGYVVDVMLKNGTHRTYKVTQQVTVTNEKFSSYVVGKDLYDKEQKRSETLVLLTCSTWNGAMHLTETILVAEAINN